MGRTAHGLSLVGLLLVIVVLGRLMATAIVGLQTTTEGSRPGTATGDIFGRMSGSGTGNISGIPTGNACKALADAARSASTLYFANAGGRSYPVKWSDMTTSTPPAYKLASNVVINGANPKELDGRGWRLIVSGGGANSPTFTCR